MWVLPDEPRPVRLMNTVWADRTGVHDALSSTEQLREWLALTGTTPDAAAPSPADLVHAVRLRDALRRLAAVRTRDARPAAASALADVDAALEFVNTAAAAAARPRLVRVGSGLGCKQVEPGARAGLAQLALDAVDLLGAPSTQLRACQAPGCVLYFVRDHPRREWCSPGCGNRARAARHYARHRGSVLPR